MKPITYGNDPIAEQWRVTA